MASIPDFKLISAATAIAIIVPVEHHTTINTLRSIHDKAYKKWQPHINVLYPFVQPPELEAAVSLLKSALRERSIGKIGVKIEDVGVFRHRKNATLFLKPDQLSTERICELRKCLVTALGRKESDGTHDGVYRPHLTIGQSGLVGDAVERLAGKVGKLLPLEWKGCSLAVLKRKVTGEMEVIEELELGDDTADLGMTKLEPESVQAGWSPCFSLSSEGEWETCQKTNEHSNPTPGAGKISILTYNLMVESSAPPFSKRFPLILDAIASVIPGGNELKILCLQEINDEMLPLILSHPLTQAKYPHSTHMPSSFFASKRSLVTLASAPFRSFTLQFDERHKSSLVIKFLDNPITVANVHLTSALMDSSVAAKLHQMASLAQFLRSEQSTRQNFVAGDFNLTSSSSTIQTALARRIITPSSASAVRKVIDKDIWEDAYLKYHAEDCEEERESEKGATFDRVGNPLAALSNAPIDNQPQRYDRILWQKREGTQMEVEHSERFGFANEDGICGSDHYGVCATLSLYEPTQTILNSGNEKKVQTSSMHPIVDDTDLELLLKPYMPTEEDKIQRENAIEVLQKSLGSDVILAPLGSYAMDTYFTDSDIDLLVIGSVSPPTFFGTAQTQLKSLQGEEASIGEDLGDGIKGIHLINSLVPIIEVVVCGVKIDLQYCQAAELLSSYDTISLSPNLDTLIFNDSIISKLPPSSLRPLNTYRDTAFLLTTIPNLQTYKIAHRFLSLYLKRRGLYSAKFGYLGGIHLSLLLNNLVKSFSLSSALSESANAASIVRSFFNYYATFDWAGEVVADPMALEKKDGCRVSRSSREAIVIQAIHSPTARPNVASSCSRLSALMISREFALSVEQLAKGEWLWCLRPKSDSVFDFLHGYRAFICVTLDVWNLVDLGKQKARDVLGGVESKITGLMVSLGRIEALEGRVWPERFSERTGQKGCEQNDKGEEDEDEDQIKAIYLVGLSGKSEDDEQKKLVNIKVLQAMRAFERTVQEMRGFDEKFMYIGVEVISGRKVLKKGFVVHS